MQHRRRIGFVALAALAGMLVVAPLASVAYAAGTCDLSPAVPLEVGIGSVSSSTGLTNYISQVYQFIVGSIGVIAAVMIMFNGMRWVTAGGSSENITVARSGISSAMIGLIIAITSFVLLYAVNASLVELVDICPEGLDFSGSSAGTSWTTCPGGSDSECTSVSYCILDGADCRCDSIASGDSTVSVCRPSGENVLPSGAVCTDGRNCTYPLICIGNDTSNPGTCQASTSGTVCSTDDDCDTGLTCELVTSTLGQCLEPTGRSNGTYCDSSTQCESGVCNDSTATSSCVAGDESTTAACYSDEHCLPSYSCDSSTERCVANSSGSSCSQYDTECGSGLFCVENDGGIGSTCQDGSNDSDCDGNNECDSGFCGKNLCTDGSMDSFCDDDSDCISRLHCDYSGVNTCQP